MSSDVAESALERKPRTLRYGRPPLVSKTPAARYFYEPFFTPRTEHIGVQQSPQGGVQVSTRDGKDVTTEFTNAMTDRYATMQPGATDDDCGGHGTSYLYQNFPSHDTKAKNDDGTPMHNWWVYLFY